MKTYKNTTQTSPLPTLQNSWLQAHTFDALSLLAALFVAYILFKKGSDHGQLKAVKLYDESLSKFKENLQITTDSIRLSHNELQAGLKKATLIPDQHTLVPLDEGTTRHSLPSGYVMVVERKFEHRAVAESILGRELAPNEIVHHIYGPARDDNSPANLCVLDREQHDLFHTFLQRESRLKGHYPRVAHQKSLLRRFYKGILLEQALQNKVVAYPAIPSAEAEETSDEESKALLLVTASVKQESAKPM